MEKKTNLQAVKDQKYLAPILKDDIGFYVCVDVRQADTRVMDVKFYVEPKSTEVLKHLNERD